MNRLHNKGYGISVGVLLVLVAAFAYRHQLVNLYKDVRHGDEEVHALELRLENVGLEHEELAEKVEGLGEDSQAVEEAIRSSKGLVREGEIIFRVTLPEESASKLQELD